MKKTMTVFCVLAAIGWGSTVMADDHMSHDGNNPMGASGKGKMAGMPDDDHKAMGEHGKGKMTGMTRGDTFEHHAVIDGIGANFKIMSLTSMSMKDPEGHTHHITVEYRDDATKEQMKGAAGKVKVIGPDEKVQTNLLKNYGGMYAANVTFKGPGKYAVICLIKSDEKKLIYKF